MSSSHALWVIVQVINPGWLGLVLTALPLRDKSNPAMIFSEQEIVISTSSGTEKAELICRGRREGVKKCPCIHGHKAISDNSEENRIAVGEKGGWREVVMKGIRKCTRVCVCVCVCQWLRWWLCLCASLCHGSTVAIPTAITVKNYKQMTYLFEFIRVKAHICKYLMIMNVICTLYLFDLWKATHW